MDDIADAATTISVHQLEREAPPTSLFQLALGADFDALPAPVQSLHSVQDRHTWTGRARVTRGRSAFANLLCRLIGFPPEIDETPLTVTIERRDDKESWTRCFGSSEFRSVLSLRDGEGAGHVHERFGVMGFDINLQRAQDQLHFPVARGTLLGIPLPNWLLPRSEAMETAEGGRFQFDIKISLPGIGLLVRYHGWLEPVRHDD